MKSIFTLATILTFTVATAGIEKKISREEYIEIWREVAVRQMIDMKIPASITLAQAILESGCGNSDLAVKGKNHFGIKCTDWSGDKFYLDDDQKNECFRMYENAEHSYNDHGLFLTTRPRYSNLFNLDITDYKAWSKGLKEAGYATNPKYPKLLNDLIEELKLTELDNLGSPTLKNESLAVKVETTNPNTVNLKEVVKKTHIVNLHTNNVKYIVAQKGDTYYRIAKEFELGLWQLYKYNDFDAKKDVLVAGDIIYIQPKRKKSKDKRATYNVKKSVTMRQVSQQEALKLNSLMKLNEISNPDELLAKGEMLKLH